MPQTEIEVLGSQIKATLADIEHPGYKQTLEELGFFSHIELEGETVRIVMKTPDADRKVQIGLETQIRTALTKTNFPYKFKVRFEVDESLKPEDIGNRIKGVKNIIAVGSGKGGVGKSTVSANIAIAMAQRGLKVGLLDADIYGPSLGKLFGLTGKVALDGDGKNKIYPVEKEGIKLISFSFLLNPDQAVVWRGPMLGKALEQFLYEMDWGELDYLIIDLPPGTGDVQLSLAQLVDVDGAVIVTTPQNVALLDASRAVNMFQQVKIPILGVIENMSGFVCPHCGKTTHIFSKNGADTFSAKYKVPTLGHIPLEKSIMDSGEEGKPIVAVQPDGEISKAYAGVVDMLALEVAKYK